MRPPYLTPCARRRLVRAAALGLALMLAGAPAALAGSGGGGLGGGATGGGGPSGGGAPVATTTTTTTTTATTRTTPTRTTPTRTTPTRTTTTTTSATTTSPAGTTRGGELVITGGGDGHGVGMSQYGAEGYALHGASAAGILAHYYTGTALGQAGPGRAVSVLLADGRASFSGAARAGRVRLSPARTYTVTADGVGVTLHGGGGGGGRTLVTSAAQLTVTGPGPLSTNGARYDGALRFSADGTGGVQTVNVVGLDDYVRGVVAAEMPSSWAPAALEAQAIAARTYAITTTVDGAGYGLYDDTRSQMYGGVSAETAPSNVAVAATAGQIVTYGGRPAVTYFFASSGGHTESVQNVWPGTAPEPWLVGVPDPYDGVAGNPYHDWRHAMSLAAATRRLGSLVHGRLERIVVTERGVSPRVMTANVIGSRGTTAATGSALAAALGMPSTDMSFAVTR